MPRQLFVTEDIMPETEARLQDVQRAINRILRLLMSQGNSMLEMGAQEILDDLLSRSGWSREP